MHANEQLIHNFYTAFQNKDYKTMQACYADNATFSDSVFKNLDGNGVRAMWEMLCKNAKDFRLEYSDVWADDSKGGAKWTAYYTFSATGRRVTNRVTATFTFENGKIAAHKDMFSFYAWAGQAFGIMGRLLGWTSFFKNKVQNRAMVNLQAFMKTNPDR